MKRRAFLAGIGAAAAPLLVARAQQPARVFRIGCMFLAPLESPVAQQLLGAFREGLRELGYVEGQSLAFEHRSAEGQIERFPDLAADLVALTPDLIATMSNAATHAAGRATTTIPIVCFNLGDPVGEGLVASLARPGGNLTGFTIFAPELAPKALSLLHQAFPMASRIAALWFPGSLTEHTAEGMLRKAETTAQALGVALLLVRGRGADDLDDAFSTMVRDRAEALLVLPSPASNVERQRIADLAARHRLPSMSWSREYVEAGGLLAYGSNLPENWRRRATIR